MWRGLFTAASGMITEMKRTDVISNNLANAATTGYKRDKAVHGEFDAMVILRYYDHDDGALVGMMTGNVNSSGTLNTSARDVTQFKNFSVDPLYKPHIGRLGLGDFIDEVAVDYSEGPIESTGNELDLAVIGDGFFTIQAPQGIRYTRNGAFFMDRDGFIKDIRGYNLLNIEGQPVQIPRDMYRKDIEITEDGAIYIKGNEVEPYEENPDQLITVGTDRVALNRQLLTQIQLVAFNDPRALQKEGDNLFFAVEDAEGNLAQPQPANGEILQGALEKSNVQIVQEMVELIHNHRTYEANAKAISTQDDMLDKSVNNIALLS